MDNLIVGGDNSIDVLKDSSCPQRFACPVTDKELLKKKFGEALQKVLITNST